MSTNAVNPFNLRGPIWDQIVTPATGVPVDMEQKWRTNLQMVLRNLATINVADSGARGDGVADDTPAFTDAIGRSINAGGGFVLMPPGTYSVNTITIPANAPPITLVGQGRATVLKRRRNLASGVGLLDIYASNFSASDFKIDGNVTVPVGLMYNADFNGIGGNDPMADSLARNTSIWVHGPASGFSFERLMFEHTGGYALLLDAMNGDLEDIDIVRLLLRNNRPNLFGTNPGNLFYGSWTGGIFAKGDGRTATSGIVRNLLVSQCKFKRNTGNQIWSHLYGLTRLHQNFRFTDCFFEDIGLDGIEVGGVTGGVVSGNLFHRIGYTTVNDTDPAIPRWLAGVQATALDSSGIVLNVPYTNNEFLSCNGGTLDLDGHGQSTVSNNVARIPSPTDPEYAEDSIAISGVNNNGSTSYCLNLGNTAQTEQGASNVEISGNSIIGYPFGSLRLFAARFCHAQNNLIVAPANSGSPPISIGPTGTGPNQRATGNVVAHNAIQYSPGTPAPAIFEDPTISPFLSSDKNFVYGNVPVQGNGEAFEFQPDPSSSSVVSTFFPPTLNYIAVENGAANAIACAAGSGGALTPSLTVTVKLAHSLQAGANTFAYNGGAALAIKSHRNPANDIAVAYVSGATVMLEYNGTLWLDTSQ